MGRRAAARKKPGSGARASRSPLVLVLLLLLLVGILYGNTLGHDFAFDDVTLILQNPQVTQLRWGEILSTKSYRPVRTLTYAVNYWVGEKQAFGYHLVNLLLHALNVILVLELFRRLGGSLTWAAAGALIFAAHPVQTAAVAYVSGRKDLLATMFLLAGLLAYLGFRESRKLRWLLVAFLSFILGVLSKETALVFPVLLVLTDLYYRQQGKPSGFLSLFRSLLRFWWFYLLLAGAAALGVYYSVEVLQASRMEGMWGGSWSTNWGTSFKLFVHYLRLALFPHPLVADYLGQVFPVSEGWLEPATLLAVALTAAFLALAAVTFFRVPPLSYGLLWFWISLLPVLQLIPFHELAADHFLYLPLVGIAFVAGFGLDRLVQQPAWKVPAWGVFATLILASSVATVDRNRDWKNNETLWTATYRVAPGSYRANCNLGGLAQQKRDLEAALRLTLRCAELDPSKSLPWSNLGGVYRDLGSQALRAGEFELAQDYLEQAVQYSEKALKIEDNPWARSNLADAFKDLAILAESRGEGALRVALLRRRAIREFERAVRRAAGYDAQSVLIFKLGAVHLDAGRYAEALRYFRQCVDRLPQWAQAQAATGYAYLQIGRYRESIRYFERGLALQKDLDSYLGMARAQEALGDTQRAKETLLSALEAFPGQPEVMYHLGRLSLQEGKRTEARAYLLRALQAARGSELSGSAQELLQQIRRLESGSKP